MTLSGPCESCGAQIQGGHGLCVICGVRADVGIPAGTPVVEAVSAGSPSRYGIPIQPQIAVFAAALALGFGGVIGSALSPGIETILAASAPPTVAAPVEEEVAPARGGGELGGSRESSSAGSTSSTSTAPTPVTPTPVTPAATTPVEETPIEDETPTDDGSTTEPDDEGVPDDGTTLASGTVIRVNPEAGSYSLAAGAAVSTIHSEDLPEPGIDVTVPTLNLFNGTLEEAGDRQEGAQEDTASFSGTVTFVDEEASLYVLSSAGASIPVRMPTGGKAEMPPLSALITANVGIGPVANVAPGEAEPAETSEADPGVDPAVTVPGAPPECEAQEQFPTEPVDPQVELTQESFSIDFEELTAASFAGIVQATCPELDQIVVSADDLRETNQDLLLTVPNVVDPTSVQPGESVTVNADPNPREDGSLKLTGLASDEGLKGADDVDVGQGDKAARASGFRSTSGRAGR